MRYGLAGKNLETHLEGIDLVRIVDDKIAEMWIEYHEVKEN